MKNFFTSTPGIIILVLVVLGVIGYLSGWFTPRMHGGGHGGHWHGGGWGWWGGFWPYYTVYTCPTGNCVTTDGSLGAWVTNINGTCSCVKRDTTTNT